MPYSGAGDKNLPENVKSLPEDKRAQWVEVFNSVLADCQDNGGKDCEATAFAQANGVIEQQETPPPDETPPAETPPTETAPITLGDKIKDILAAVEVAIKQVLGLNSESTPVEEPKKEGRVYLPLDPKKRAVSFPAIYDQAMVMISQQDQMAMLYDIYYDDVGLFALIASNGKVYRVPVEVKDGTVNMGTWEEIQVSQSAKPLFHILRNKDNKYRWISISGTTVLNRSGEIDSRQLFDNIIKRAEVAGYPIRVFMHAGSKFRTGQCDFLARDENCLITSGLYDNTELAMREVVARTKDPSYWGDSISFLPTTSASILRMDNIEIPVYTDGIIEEISTLPESEAAAWLTATPNILEVKRMLSKRQMDAFVKLFDDDEEAAKLWLEQNSATRNKLILDAGMITRAKRDLQASLDAANEGEQTPTPEVIPDAAPTPAEMPEFSLDDAAINAIVDRVASKLDFPAQMKPMVDRIDGIATRLDNLEKALQSSKTEATETITQAIKRLSNLEKDEKAKKHEWLNDLPNTKPTNVTFRPRQERKTSDHQSDPTEVLQKIPVKY